MEAIIAQFATIRKITSKTIRWITGKCIRWYTFDDESVYRVDDLDEIISNANYVYLFERTRPHLISRTHR